MYIYGYIYVYKHCLPALSQQFCGLCNSTHHKTDGNPHLAGQCESSFTHFLYPESGIPVYCVLCWYWCLFRGRVSSTINGYLPRRSVYFADWWLKVRRVMSTRLWRLWYHSVVCNGLYPLCLHVSNTNNRKFAFHYLGKS